MSGGRALGALVFLNSAQAFSLASLGLIIALSPIGILFHER